MVKIIDGDAFLEYLVSPALIEQHNRHEDNRRTCHNGKSLGGGGGIVDVETPSRIEA